MRRTRDAAATFEVRVRMDGMSRFEKRASEAQPSLSNRMFVETCMLHAWVYCTIVGSSPLK